MELKDFVSTTLRDIHDGISDAISNYKGQGGFAVAFQDKDGNIDWSKYTTAIEFDIAITVTDKNAGTGKAGVKIFEIVDIGGDVAKSREKVAANRIKFSVPVLFPSKVFQSGTANAAHTATTTQSK